MSHQPENIFAGTQVVSPVENAGEKQLGGRSSSRGLFRVGNL